ncbi:DNA replication/repair protein RecF [Ornithinimicrobium ciconiae]|uniref:DNA replication and repair protein RecF n=1 Tax=Ornithinimicrobium ciconiae TaxID=2594265 RepID=A0A516G6J7_9MICO|nr:DNA replication/repair protein RecF [Ornithinimicrobium ciconiae]QDO87147.1 DNA replication/repair protein RecF [Ornithinimicrobium ciconiae]
MHLRHLSVTDFRSYHGAEVSLTPGITTLLGRNGVGKTNLVEAAGYLATLGSHRVSTDAPLVRHGAESAIVRGAVVREGRESIVELEILPGRANRARLNKSPQTRPRDLLGTLRTVLFAPEDLSLVKGDPAERRRFLDDLLVARQPRWAGVRSDYDKALKQRNALLRSGQHLWRGGRKQVPQHRLAPGESVEDARAAVESTLAAWDTQVAQVGAALTYARLRLLRDLGPYLAEAYSRISDAAAQAQATYRSSLEGSVAEAITAGEVPEQQELYAATLAVLQERRREEQERGVTLVGPHRDELVLSLGELPAKGYASHGESWSIALALRLASFRLLRHDVGTDPVLVLDDVFAELDSGRRERLAELVSECEQVLITAAVAEDVPAWLSGRGTILDVADGAVVPRESTERDTGEMPERDTGEMPEQESGG